MVAESRSLVSALVQLRTRTKQSVPLYTGIFAHAALLNLVRRENALLAERLHESARCKPFTVSPLFGSQVCAEGEMIRLDPRVSYALRFTSLEPRLGDLLQEWSVRPPATVALGRPGERAVLEVEEVAVRDEDKGLAAVSSYDACVEAATGGAGPRRKTLDLHFMTPTAFRKGDLTMTVPLPHLVYRHLAAKWLAFAPETLAREMEAALLDLARRCGRDWESEGDGAPALPGALSALVPMGRATLRLQPITFADRGNVREGFVGAVTYDLVRIAHSPGATALEILSKFAFFGGVGYGTAWGMGQAQPGR